MQDAQVSNIEHQHHKLNNIWDQLPSHNSCNYKKNYSGKSKKIEVLEKFEHDFDDTRLKDIDNDNGCKIEIGLEFRIF